MNNFTDEILQIIFEYAYNKNDYHGLIKFTHQFGSTCKNLHRFCHIKTKWQCAYNILQGRYDIPKDARHVFPQKCDSGKPLYDSEMDIHGNWRILNKTYFSGRCSIGMHYDRLTPKHVNRTWKDPFEMFKRVYIRKLIKEYQPTSCQLGQAETNKRKAKDMLKKAERIIKRDQKVKKLKQMLN